MNEVVIGIFLNMFGVLILFYYGMPFRVPKGGKGYLMLEQEYPAEKQIDANYQSKGYIGLVFVIAGSAMQAVAAWT